jgi:two-component system, NtrC family, nitrogen regulation response regulator NtrX
MPDTLTRAAARFARPSASAIELTGRSPAIARVQEFVRRAAASEGGVLIIAERGCAVDSLARELHTRSRRASGLFVKVECSSVDVASLDRELFGAHVDSPSIDLESVTTDSCLAAARGGTLFLQDVADLPAGVQSRLARVVRDGEVRIDGTTVETGFRLVASATMNLEPDVDAHRFRADLFRRLSGVRIDLPPLRERQEDVPALASRLLDELCSSRGLTPRSFTQAALALIGALAWPGNLLELHDAIDRVVTESSDEVVQIEHLLPALRLQRTSQLFAPNGSLREARMRFERDYIASVLQHHEWRMAEAAETLGMQRPNLYRKARQLGIPLTRGSE